MKRPNLVWIAILFGLVPVLGCHVQDHPWSGEPYQEPAGHTNPPQSIYAPMPSILPSIDATATESVEGEMEEELRMLIDGDSLSL